MQEQAYQKQIAYLEFVNDQLMAEIEHIDHILRFLGFSEGLHSIKAAAQEALEEDVSESE